MAMMTGTRTSSRPSRRRTSARMPVSMAPTLFTMPMQPPKMRRKSEISMPSSTPFTGLEMMSDTLTAVTSGVTRAMSMVATPMTTVMMRRMVYEEIIWCFLLPRALSPASAGEFGRLGWQNSTNPPSAKGYFANSSRRRPAAAA